MNFDSRKVWLVGLAVIVAMVFGMWIFSPTEVVVTGQGKVSVPATSASFNVTVSMAGATPTAALTALRGRLDALKGKLIEIHIDPSNISESQITITPAAAVVANATGYQALSTLTVKTTNVSLAPEMIVEMYSAGATLVSQPSVAVENQEKLEQQALTEALAQAQQNLQATIGFRPIAKVIGIQQASSGNVGTVTSTKEDKTGQFEVSKAVSVTYRVW
jgi:uncharacterized protein YggE